MKRVLLLLLLLLSFGCSRNHFNVPAENYASRVRVLGVAPVLVDEDSDVRHPQRERLLSLVSQASRNNEYQLVRMLRETGTYYSVSLLDGDPRGIFSSLFFRREKRDDASIQYNKYFWKIDELRALMRKNNLDAIMLVVVSGLCRNDKVYSSTLMSSREGEYNYLIMTAQVLDSNGTVLWEYPNFRSRVPSYAPMLALQYPDFSEAEANGLEQAEIKFKTIEGIRNRLDEKRKDFLRRDTRESVVYYDQFHEMASLLTYDAAKEQKAAAVPKAQATTPAPPSTVPAPASVSPQATPPPAGAADKPGAPAAAPAKAAPPAEAGSTGSDEIVAAPESAN